MLCNVCQRNYDQEGDTEYGQQTGHLCYLFPLLVGVALAVLRHISAGHHYDFLKTPNMVTHAAIAGVILSVSWILAKL